MRLCAFLVAILITVTSSAQSPLLEDLKLARKHYELKQFNQARIMFESVEEYASLDTDDERRLARIYEATDDRESALLKAQGIIQRPDVIDRDFLFLAELYKKEAQYDEALFVLDHYARRGGENARLHIENVEFAQNLLSYEKNCDLENLALNTSSAESGVTFLNGQLVYATHRVDLDGRFGIKGAVDQRPQSVLLQTEDELKGHSTPIKTQDRAGDEFGFASYSADGRMMVYVKSEFKPESDGLTSTQERMALYYSVVDELGEWQEDRAFPYNSALYANGFPYLSQDGNSLFYASNMAGGLGGFDLYISHYRNGSWTAPANLGEEVNTPGNEITPFLTDGKLYFASDYLPGLGGYDVYSIQNVNNSWVDLAHMGACVNSPEDDYGFILDPAGEMAYFASTRRGGKGHDDIYRIQDAESISEITLVQPEINELPAFAQLDAKQLTIKGQMDKEVISVPELTYEVELANMVEMSSATDVISDNEMMEANSEVAEEIELNELIRVDLFSNLQPTVHDGIDRSIREELPIERLDDMDTEGVLILEDQEIAQKNLMPYEKVYFIQIAALSRYTDNLQRFSHFKRFGNVYRMDSGGKVKIRIGYFGSQAEALKVLKVLKEKGIREAFIVGDILDANRLELIAARDQSKDTAYDERLTSSYRSKYKVRVAAYRAPGRFQTNLISDLGNIEHWTKGEWKIIVLTGYTTKGRAEGVLRQVVKRGFKDAFIVQEHDGELLRVK